MKKILSFLILSLLICSNNQQAYGINTSIIDIPVILKKQKNQEKLGYNRYIKGVTFFGNANPFNLMNSIETSALKREMAQIKKDGFNAIILLVPWCEFQPSLDPVTYNQKAFDNLAKYMMYAEKNGLNVILRLSYFWDLYPFTKVS